LNDYLNYCCTDDWAYAYAKLRGKTCKLTNLRKPYLDEGLTLTSTECSNIKTAERLSGYIRGSAFLKRIVKARN